MKKFVTFFVVVAILMSLAVLPTFADALSLTVNVRVEGKSQNLFFGEITTNNKENYNVVSILKLADAQSEGMVIEGLENGYITAINGERIGQTEKGLDGYVVRINGEYVPYAELSSYALKDGDEILVYYSNEFDGGIILEPIIDTEKIEQGYIRFTYEKPSQDGHFVTAEAIVGAIVTWYCDDVAFTYVTDAQGGIYVEKTALTSGAHRIGLELIREDGTPGLLRLAPNYTVDVPVDIGDTVLVYACGALAALSLAAIIILSASFKKAKKIK